MILHGDWFEWNEKQVCGFEDDASRKVLALQEFDAAKGANTLRVFKEGEKAVEEYPAYVVAVNTDRGSQFYANKQKGNPCCLAILTQLVHDRVSEAYLARKGIRHILSRRNNPQTNGKFERWIQEFKKHRHNNRIHGAL